MEEEVRRVLLVLFALLPINSWSRTYVATTAQEIQSYTDSLEAGDTLLIQPGTYDMDWDIRARTGNSTEWIVITGTGSGVVINGTSYDNVIDVYDCHYMEIRDLEITNSYIANGIDRIKFRTTSDNCALENLEIHELTGVGISANPAGESFTYITIRRCHVYDITGVGEGMYLGNHDGLSPVHSCVVEANWVHDCHPRKGIQFKRGTYSNTIQDNVVYNCDEAGIVMYKTDRLTSVDNNAVRRNAIWNTPEGIFAVGQTDIENNVIFNCSYGINVRNYGGWGMEDLYIRNNTIYDCGVTCLRLDDWNAASGEMVCVNNACYQDLISRSAIQAPDGIGPGAVEKNRHYGQSQVAGSALGNAPSVDFRNANATPGLVDLYPTVNSSLVDSGGSTHGAPVDDFNLLARPVGANWDVGAYEWSQEENPGWQIQEGFKELDTGVSEARRRSVDGGLRVFQSGSTLRFVGLSPGDRIRIYSVTGRLAHCSGILSDGCYYWNASQVPNGFYFCVVEGDMGRKGCAVRVLVLR